VGVTKKSQTNDLLPKSKSQTNKQEQTRTNKKQQETTKVNHAKMDPHLFRLLETTTGAQTNLLSKIQKLECKIRDNTFDDETTRKLRNLITENERIIDLTREDEFVVNTDTKKCIICHEIDPRTNNLENHSGPHLARLCTICLKVDPTSKKLEKHGGHHLTLKHPESFRKSQRDRAMKYRLKQKEKRELCTICLRVDPNSKKMAKHCGPHIKLKLPDKFRASERTRINKYRKKAKTQESKESDESDVETEVSSQKSSEHETESEPAVQEMISEGNSFETLGDFLDAMKEKYPKRFKYHCSLNRDLYNDMEKLYKCTIFGCDFRCELKNLKIEKFNKHTCDEKDFYEML
jgi:5'(3')-deoxyribonucleotidase